MANRNLSLIAKEISMDWAKQGKGVNFAAKPYLSAMYSLDSIEDNYYADSGKSVVRYFLGNATSWKGDKAKAIKAELKSMLGEKLTKAEKDLLVANGATAG